MDHKIFLKIQYPSFIETELTCIYDPHSEIISKKIKMFDLEGNYTHLEIKSLEK